MLNIKYPFRGYGIQISPLTDDDLKLVLKWRNADDVIKYMNIDKPLSFLSLKLWFKKIRKDNSSIPFIISLTNVTGFLKKIGFVEFRNIDYNTFSCEYGIFLDNQFINKGIGTKLLFCQEKFLNAIKIDNIILRIRKINERNIHIWKKIGAKLEKEDQDFYYFISHKSERYKHLTEISKNYGYFNEWSNFLSSKDSGMWDVTWKFTRALVCIVLVLKTQDRPTEVETLLGNPALAKEKLNWTPSTTFEEMVDEMVKEDLRIAIKDKLVDDAGLGRNR